MDTSVKQPKRIFDRLVLVLMLLVLSAIAVELYVISAQMEDLADSIDNVAERIEALQPNTQEGPATTGICGPEDGSTGI